MEQQVGNLFQVRNQLLKLTLERNQQDMIQQQIIKALQQISFKPNQACFILNKLFDTSDLFMSHLILVARAPDTKCDIRSQALLAFNNYLIKSINKYECEKQDNGRSSHQYYTRIGQYSQLLRSIFFDQQHLAYYAYKKIVIPSHIKYVSHFHKGSMGSNHLWQLLKDLREKQISKELQFDCITVLLQVAVASKIDYDQVLKMIKRCFPDYLIQTLIYMQNFEGQLGRIQDRLDRQRNQEAIISTMQLQNMKTYFGERIKPINISFQLMRQTLTHFDSSKDVIKQIRQRHSHSNLKFGLSEQATEIQMKKLEQKIKKEHEKNRQLKNRTFNELVQNENLLKVVTGVLSDRLCFAKQYLVRFGWFCEQLQNLKSNVFIVLISIMKKIDEKYNFQEQKNRLLHLIPALVVVVIHDLVAYQKGKQQENFPSIQNFKILVPTVKQSENQRIIAYMFKFLIQATQKKELYKLFHQINAESTIYLIFPYLDATRTQKLNFQTQPEDFIAIINYYRYPIEDQIDYNCQLKINVSQFVRKMKKVDGFVSFFFNTCIQLLLSKFNVDQNCSQNSQQIKRFIQKNERRVFNTSNSKNYSLISALWGLTILGIDQKNSEAYRIQTIFKNISKSSIALLRQVLYLLINNSKLISQIQLAYLFNFIKFHGLIFGDKQVMFFAMYMFEVDYESQGLYLVVNDFFFQTIQTILNEYLKKLQKEQYPQHQNQQQKMVFTNKKRWRNYESMQEQTTNARDQFLKDKQTLESIFNQSFIEKFISYTYECNQPVWISKISETIKFQDQERGQMVSFFRKNPNGLIDQGIIPSGQFCRCLMKKIDKELSAKYPQQHIIILCLNLISELIELRKLARQIQKQIFDWILQKNIQNDLLSKKYLEEVSEIVLYIIFHYQQIFKSKENQQETPQSSILSQGNNYQQLFGNKLLKVFIQNYRKMIKSMSSCRTRQRSIKLCKMREVFFNIICYSIDNSCYYKLVLNQEGLVQPIQNTAFLNNMKEVIRAITDNLTYYSLFADQVKIQQQTRQGSARRQDSGSYFSEFYQMIIFEATILFSLVLIRRNQQFDRLREKFDIAKVTQIEHTSLSLSEPWNQVFCILSHCFILNKQIKPILRPNCIINFCLLYLWYQQFIPKQYYQPQSQKEQQMTEQIFKYLVNNFTQYQSLSSSIQTIIGLKISVQINQIIHSYFPNVQPNAIQVDRKFQCLRRLLTLTANVLLHIHQFPNKSKLEYQIDYKTKALCSTLPVSINHSPCDSRKTNMFNNFRLQTKILIDMIGQPSKNNFKNRIRQILGGCQELVKQLFQIESIPIQKGSQTRKILKIKK